MQKQLFAITIGAAMMMSGCSTFQPETYACNNLLSAPADGARVTLRTLENGKTAEARFNGVSAICENQADGIEMAIDAGLIIQRPQSEGEDVTRAEVPVILAILNDQDELVANETYSYRVAFDSNRSTLYPVVQMSVMIPANGRAVISLSPQVVR